MSAGQRPLLNLTSELTSPTEFELSAHDGRFPVASFDSDEANLFEQQMNDLIADLPNSVVGEVLKQREQTIARAAAMAKHDLEAKNFGGINAGDNEFGFSMLRPGHIRYDGSSIINDWYFQPGSTGWNDWIGTSANPFVVDEDQVVVILGVMDQEKGPSEISGFNVQSFGRNMDMLPRDMNSMRLQDNETDVQVTQTQTLIGQEQDEIHARLYYDRDVERQPRPLGFTFSLGRFLNVDDYSPGDYNNL